MAVRRPSAAWAIAFLCLTVALVASTFLFGTPPDEEEFRFAILSAWLRWHAVVAGSHPFWSSQFGFGVPQPFIPHFGLHPLAPLSAALSPVAWTRLLLLAHTISGTTGMWFLCRRLKVAPGVAAVCVTAYLLSAPVQNYVLEDFWPSHYIVWTSIPWILLLTWRLLEEHRPESWRTGVALGLVIGLTIANTNPGHAGVYAALVLGIAATSAGAIRRQWAAVTLAIVIAAAIAAPNAAHLVSERPFFPPDLGLSNVPEPLPVASALRALATPFGEREGPRTLFLGAPFAALALIGCVWLARERRDLVLAIAIAGVMLFTEWIPASLFSARYQFRDPLTLCALLLAGCVADRLWNRPRSRPVVVLLLVAQTAAVVAFAWPYIERTWRPEGLSAAAFRGATGDAALSERLLAVTQRRGRLLFSPAVDRAVAERGLVEDGLGLNALGYKGQAVVNGSFKAVSTDALWPNDRLYYGWIRTPQALVESDLSLDALGVRYVLGHRSERVAAGLREVWSATTRRGAELVLFENADAGSGALLVDPDRIPRELPPFPECDHDRLLCRDVGALMSAGGRTVSAIERRGNEIRATWPPVEAPRMLVMTEMYRPGWTASAGSEPVEVRSLHGGFMVIPVPPRVSSVRLRYRPRAIIAASVASYTAIVLSLGVLVFRSRGGVRPSAIATRRTERL